MNFKIEFMCTEEGVIYPEKKTICPWEKIYSDRRLVYVRAKKENLSIEPTAEQFLKKPGLKDAFMEEEKKESSKSFALMRDNITAPHDSGRKNDGGLATIKGRVIGRKKVSLNLQNFEIAILTFIKEGVSQYATICEGGLGVMTMKVSPGDGLIYDYLTLKEPGVNAGFGKALAPFTFSKVQETNPENNFTRLVSMPVCIDNGRIGNIFASFIFTFRCDGLDYDNATGKISFYKNLRRGIPDFIQQIEKPKLKKLYLSEEDLISAIRQIREDNLKSEIEDIISQVSESDKDQENDGGRKVYEKLDDFIDLWEMVESGQVSVDSMGSHIANILDALETIKLLLRSSRYHAVERENSSLFYYSVVSLFHAAQFGNQKLEKASLNVLLQLCYFKLDDKVRVERLLTSFVAELGVFSSGAHAKVAGGAWMLGDLMRIKIKLAQCFYIMVYSNKSNLSNTFVRRLVLNLRETYFQSSENFGKLLEAIPAEEDSSDKPVMKEYIYVLGVLINNLCEMSDNKDISVLEVKKTDTSKKSSLFLRQDFRDFKKRFK